MIITSYLRRNLSLLATICIVFAIMIGIPFYLYEIEKEIILYPGGLSIAIVIIYFSFDYIKYKKRYNQIQYYINNGGIDINKIDKQNDIIISKYKQIINLLQKENTKIIDSNKKEQEEIIDYYTMWVHQIKTPIAALNFLVENSEIENKRQLEVELFKIEQYVEMVLSYLRLDSEYNDFVAEKLKIDEIIKTVLKKYSTIFIEKKITLEYEKTDVIIISDKKWLEFCIEQILSNALKYSKNNGKIKIELTENALTIEDRGIGIKKDNLPRIFEKGFTGFNGRRNRKSSGLGLYLTKKALDKLGQAIHISSEINNGTKVEIIFDKRSVVKRVDN